VLSNLAPNYRVPATVLGVKLLLELDNEKWNFQFVELNKTEYWRHKAIKK
jgi:hypothetical protein